MKHTVPSVLLLLFVLAFGVCPITFADPPKPALAAHTAPFIQSAYLWTQATDTDLSGDGDWGRTVGFSSKASGNQWLNVDDAAVK